jgi:DNA ligase-4
VNHGRLAASKRQAEDLAAELVDGGGTPAPPKKRAGGVPRHLQMAQGYATAEKESEALKGVVAVVMSGGGLGPGGRTGPAGRKWLPEDREKTVKRLGGAVHKNLGPHVTHIIDADARMGGRVAAEVARLRGAADTAGAIAADGFEVGSFGGVEVVTACWLDACDKERALVPLEPKYVRYANARTAEAMAARMDAWGDRYAEVTDLNSMREAMGLVRRERQDGKGFGAGLRLRGTEQGVQGPGERPAGEPPIPPRRATSSRPTDVLQDGPTSALPIAPFTTSILEDTVAAALRSIRDDEVVTRLGTRYTLLRGMTVYTPPNHPALRLRLRLLGAKLLDAPLVEATHVALPSSSSLEERRAVRETLRDAMLSQFEAERVAADSKHLVSERWVQQCERACARVDELPEGQWFEE